jgi:hypothetical protein
MLIMELVVYISGVCTITILILLKDEKLNYVTSQHDISRKFINWFESCYVGWGECISTHEHDHTSLYKAPLKIHRLVRSYKYAYYIL